MVVSKIFQAFGRANSGMFKVVQNNYLKMYKHTNHKSNALFALARKFLKLFFKDIGQMLS